MCPLNSTCFPSNWPISRKIRMNQPSIVPLIALVSPLPPSIMYSRVCQRVFETSERIHQRFFFYWALHTFSFLAIRDLFLFNENVYFFWTISLVPRVSISRAGLLGLGNERGFFVLILYYLVRFWKFILLNFRLMAIDSNFFFLNRFVLLIFWAQFSWLPHSSDVGIEWRVLVQESDNSFHLILVSDSVSDSWASISTYHSCTSINSPFSVSIYFLQAENPADRKSCVRGTSGLSEIDEEGHVWYRYSFVQRSRPRLSLPLAASIFLFCLSITLLSSLENFNKRDY